MWSRIRWWRRHATPGGDATPRHTDELVEYNTRDARDLFSHLLRRVRHGEEIVIAHAGRPVAKLIPYSGDGPRRRGVVRAQIVFRDDAPP
ncbi:MAG TPA: type II toxin-antitoxin system prevent-host-death family antitoxin [Gaiellaceae bacterium]|nr:type II toxin-antitoxin system prevent-host-death family antitoxin [Gaiellaceae bacterium]